MNDKPMPQQEDVRGQLRRQFSEAAVERILRPSNMRPLDRPDGYGRTEKEDGETIELFLKLEGDRIAECTFTAQDCAASVACEGALTL